MGQNPCSSRKFLFVVLFLRPSAPAFQLSYPTNGIGQDSTAVKCTQGVLAGPCGCPKTHVTLTPIAVTGPHMRHGIFFTGMP